MRFTDAGLHGHPRAVPDAPRGMGTRLIRMSCAWHDAVREVLAKVGRLPVDAHALADDDDLFRAGLSSQAAVEVVFTLEDRFGCEFPDEAISRDNLATVGRLATLVERVATS